MSGQFLGCLDRCSPGHDAGNLGVSLGVEVRHLTGRVFVPQRLAFLPPLPLVVRRGLADPSTSSRSRRRRRTFTPATTKFTTVLSGTGLITLGQETHPLRPGSMAVIPAGVPHSLKAGPDEQLEFVIFGTPPMAMDDERARPVKPAG